MSYLVKSFFVFIIVLASYMAAAQTSVVDRVVAKVGSEIITYSELIEFQKSLQNQPLVDDLLLYSSTIDELKKNKSVQLRYLVDEKILEVEIKKSNGSVAIERVEQEISSIAKRNGLSRSQFLASLKTQGVALSSYQKFIKDRLERQSLIESQISSRIRVGEEDVVAEYNRTFGASKLSSEYTLSHIFFNPKKGGVEAATKRAELVLSKLRQGESFEVLAEQNSQDPNFSSGGQFGVFKGSELSEDFQKSLVGLEVGQSTEIVKSKNGLHILKVTGKKTIPDPQFLAKKDQIQSQLFEAAFKKQFAMWLQQKRASLEVSDSL